MKFLKKIGAGVKKVVKKNVNFKTLVKTVGKASGAIPGIGGFVAGTIGSMQDAHYAKKEEKKALEQLQQEPLYDTLSNTQKVEAVNQQVIQNVTSKEPTPKEVLIAAAGGALSGAGTALAGSTTVQTAGATMLDGTIMTYLKNNWLKVVGILAGVVVVLRLLTGATASKKRR
jgi:uncharacterized membrane protein YdbT with pleckstrin-like domain